MSGSPVSRLPVSPVDVPLPAEGPVTAAHATRVQAGARVNDQVTANSLKLAMFVKFLANLYMLILNFRVPHSYFHVRILEHFRMNVRIEFYVYAQTTLHVNTIEVEKDFKY